MRLTALLAVAATCVSLAGDVVAQGMDAALPGYVEVAGNDTVAMFVHADSIRRDGAFLEAWQLWNYAEPRNLGGTPYLSVIVLERFECAGRRLGGVAVTYYALRRASGEIVASDTYADPDMRPQAPGTLGAAMLDFVCARG